MPSMASHRSLAPEEVGRVLAAVRAVIDEAGSQVAAAKKIGVTQQSLSKYLRGEGAPGWAFARLVATARGVEVDELLTGRPTRAADDLVTLRSCPGWEEAAAEVARRWPALAPLVPEVASIIVPHRAPVTASLIVQFCSTWAQMSSPES